MGGVTRFRPIVLDTRAPRALAVVTAGSTAYKTIMCANMNLIGQNLTSLGRTHRI